MIHIFIAPPLSLSSSHSDSNLSVRFDDLHLGFASSTPTTTTTSIRSSTPPPTSLTPIASPTPMQSFLELQRREDEALERLEDAERRCVFVEKHSQMTLMLLCDATLAMDEKAIFGISKMGKE